MNKLPKFAKVKNKTYKINTDYGEALECNKVAESDVSEEERSLAIIYLLFGDEGLNDSENWNELLNIALKYLKCGKEMNENQKDEEVDIDLEQDWDYIKTSFFSDYQIDLETQKMHYWDFYNRLCGLTDKCILNRVRFVRNFDISQIKDSKEKEKWIKQKKQVALKKKIKKTQREKELDELFEKQMRGE